MRRKERPLTVHQLNELLLICSLVLLFAVAAVRISSRSGLPSLLLYLGIGVAIGQDGIFDVKFDNAELTQVIGYAALVVILAEGGLGTKWKEIKPALPAAVVLSTVGVAVSVGVTAAGAHYLVGLDWRQSLIIGAVVSSTDAAAVFSVLRKVPLPSRITGVLEAESGFNDAPVVILVVAFSTVVRWTTGTYCSARSPWNWRSVRAWGSRWAGSGRSHCVMWHCPRPASIRSR